MSDRVPFRVSPMLATLVLEPPEGTGWIYEEKYDGYRILAYKDGARVTLLSRNDKDRTEWFSGIAAVVAALPARTLLLDGEAVAFDRKGITRFQLLQGDASEAKFAVFDCLYQNGRDLRKQTLSVRRRAVEESIGKTGRIFPSHRMGSDGHAAYKIAQRKGYEGVIAKEEAAPYVEGRSRHWLKIKVHQEDEFVIVGYTPPAGSREYFGALLVGAYDHGKLRYAGRVGTGFSRETLKRLYRLFKPLAQKEPSVAEPPRGKEITYIQPKLVAQIAYAELTNDRKLRQPVFLGLRDDKNPRDVTFPEVK